MTHQDPAPASTAIVYDEQVVLVTDTASGIGEQLVRRFHAAGARVVIHHQQTQGVARALASELEDLRPRSVHLLRRALVNQRDARHLVMDVIRAYGRLDILVNNTATRVATPLDSIIESDIRQLLASNFMAPLYLSQAAAIYLEQHDGCIINIVDAHIGPGLDPGRHEAQIDHCVYAATQAALASLTRSLAVELAPHVRVNAVPPGTDTACIDAVLRLCSAASAATGGQVQSADPL